MSLTALPTYREANAVKAMLESPAGKAFVEEYKDRLMEAYRVLKAAREPIDIGRAQGRVEELERVVNMATDLRKYMERKNKGGE